MEQGPDRSLARAFFEALGGTHRRTVAGLLDESSLLHVAGGSGLAGDYQGSEAILALLDRMAELTGGSLRCGASNPVATEGGRIGLQGRVAGSREGRALDTSARVLVTVEEGVLREIWISHEDQPGFDAFWS